MSKSFFDPIPRPWWTEEHKRVINIMGFLNGAKFIVAQVRAGHPFKSATANLIVESANAHNELIAACKESLLALNTHEPGIAEEHAQKARVLLHNLKHLWEVK